MVAGSEHVFLVYVSRREAVQQRQPGAGAPEESVAITHVGTAGMFDEFGPAVAISRQSTHRFQRNGRAGAVEPLDNVTPSHIKPQILWLVHDVRAIGETAR